MIYIVFLVNLAITVVVEATVIWLLFRKGTFVYYSFLCNLLTNPALNLLLLIAVNFLGMKYYYAILVPLEIIVVLVETYVYRLLCKFSTKKAFSVSLLANVISFGVGLVIYMFI